jgi:hypothetical protein
MEIRKNRSLLVLALPLIVALVSLGCNLSGILNRGEQQVDLEPTPTRTPMPTFTPTPADVALIQVQEAAQQNPAQGGQNGAETAATQPEAAQAIEPVNVAPAEPPTPTPEPTQTPIPGVNVTILQNMNVRSGPGTNYPVIGPGPAGETGKVVGRNTDSSWLQVEYPRGRDGTGWLYAPLVQVTGDPATVDVVNVAPPPPPPPTPTPAAPPPPPPEPEKKYQFTPTGWHASENKAIVHFKGRMRDEQGNLVNGYSVLVDNWAWSVVSHPAGASHHYPEKGDGEWDVVIPKENLGDGVGWWWLTVVRYECPDFLSRFDAQCKQFTRLSEDVKIQVVWPDETIINADWVCHWDCDKGLYVQGFRR